MKRLICAFGALTFTACTALVPSTLGQLMTLTPLTADPEAIALQLTLPDGAGIMPGSAAMVLEATQNGETTSDTFVLEQSGDIFSVAASDLSRLRARQAMLRAAEEADPDGVSGALSLTAGPCQTGDNLSVDARISVGMRLAVDGPFLPLVRNGPLSAVFDEAEIAAWPPCPMP
ncbi:MAG: hypothetical protein AAFQ64_13895 [Pseudomonadota bacterium]